MSKLQPKIDKGELHKIWAKLIKDRDGWRCQLCGKDLAKMGGHANAHHCAGKATTLLRFSIVTGVTLCAGCHRFGVHSSDTFTAAAANEKLRQNIGEHRWQMIRDLRDSKVRQPLIEAKLNLEALRDSTI
jgi:hypothetical protein